MSSPWATQPTTQPKTSLREVMEEQESADPEEDDLARAIAESIRISENKKSRDQS